jgi:hypothetical protein
MFKNSCQVVILLLLLSGCEDNHLARDYPRVRTLPVTNITDEGALFVAEIYEPGNVEITEHGFTWALGTPDVNEGERVLLGSFSGTGRFEAEIRTALEEGITYDVCAFVKAGDYTVYGDRVKFVSLGSGAPEIIDFMPKSAGWGDTVTITGRRFSHLNISNKIFIDNCMSSPFYSSDSLLKFVVPREVIKTENSVSVSILGNVATAAEKLTFLAPGIFGFSPSEGHWGDTIIFSGHHLNYLGYLPTDGMLLNGVLLCRAFSIGAEQASFIVPGQLDELTSTVTLKYGSFAFSSPVNLALLSPLAERFSPTCGTWGSELTLYGRFNPLGNRNTVLIDNIVSAIVSTSRDSVKIRVPSSLGNSESTVTYKSGPFTVSFEDKFRLSGPEIKDFTPAEGHAGTQVKIRGKYFNGMFTEVYFGGKKTITGNVTDSVINCYVPGDIYGNSRIEVRVLDAAVESTNEFKVTNHRIHSVSPLDVSVSEVVTVSGEYFDNALVWSAGGIPVTPFSVQPGEVKFTVPPNMTYTESKVKAVRTGAYQELTSTSISDESLRLKDFVISSVGPMSGKPGDLMTVEGTHLPYFPQDAQLLIGGRAAEISFSSPERYVFVVPGNYEGEHQVTITFLGRSVVWPQNYMLNGPWKKLDDLPFLYSNGCVFDMGEEAFVVTAESSPDQRTVYRFDAATETFIRHPGTYITHIECLSTASIGRKGYVIGNRTDEPQIGLEVFNPDSLTWKSLPDYPGSFGEAPWIVADDSVLYAGSGKTVSGTSTYINNEFWKYSPTTGRWTRLSDSWFSGSLPGRQAYINGKIYAALNAIYSYDPSLNTWEYVSYVEDEAMYNYGLSVVLNEKWYTGYGDFYDYHYASPEYHQYNTAMMIFDPVTSTWSNVEYPGMSPRSRMISFTIGDVLYSGGDQNYNLYDFYKWDPLNE